MHEPKPSPESVIALLIVNKINDLPLLAINSIRRQTNATIYIGYLNESDILDINLLENVYFVNLKDSLDSADSILLTSAPYAEYTSEVFFRLVQLKWVLFIRVAEIIGNGVIVYSDLDVIWLDDVIGYVEQIYANDSMVSICIQDQTFKGIEKELCMGLFSMRVNENSVHFFELMAKNHKNALALNPRAGDDGIITDYYRSLPDKSAFSLLPQMGFPIGSLMNSYFDVGYFTGLKLGKPYIFHANYVVGRRRKLVLLLAISKNFESRFRFAGEIFSIRTELVLRKYLLRLVHIFRS